MKKYILELTGLIHNLDKNQWFDPKYPATDYTQWLAEGNTPDIEEPVVDPQIAIKLQERMALENEYLECSRQICLWAGDELAEGVYPKLEDVDFKAKASLAVTNVGQQANLLLTFMNYCFLQLKFGYNWSFEQIEYRNI